jgi:hypothetical protein
MEGGDELCTSTHGSGEDIPEFDADVEEDGDEDSSGAIASSIGASVVVATEVVGASVVEATEVVDGASVVVVVATVVVVGASVVVVVATVDVVGASVVVLVVVEVEVDVVGALLLGGTSISGVVGAGLAIGPMKLPSGQPWQSASPVYQCVTGLPAASANTSVRPPGTAILGP